MCQGLGPKNTMKFRKSTVYVLPHRHPVTGSDVCKRALCIVCMRTVDFKQCYAQYSTHLSPSANGEPEKGAPTMKPLKGSLRSAQFGSEDITRRAIKAMLKRPPTDDNFSTTAAFLALQIRAMVLSFFGPPFWDPASAHGGSPACRAGSTFRKGGCSGNRV